MLVLLLGSPVGRGRIGSETLRDPCSLSPEEYALARKERIESRGFIGLGLVAAERLPATAMGDAALVADVVKASPADVAGFREGDWVISVDGVRLSARERDVAETFASIRAGTAIAIEVMRGDRRVVVPVKSTSTTNPALLRRWLLDDVETSCGADRRAEFELALEGSMSGGSTKGLQPGAGPGDRE